MPSLTEIRSWPFSRKITAALITVMFCVLGGGSVAISFLLREEIINLIRANMRSQFVYYQNFVNRTTNTMLGNGRDVARFGEILQRTANSPFQANNEADVYLLHKIANAPEILGTGLWYEPGALFPGIHYFGPYAYWEGKEVKITREYNSPEYDYPSHDWYTMAVPADWNRSVRRPREYYISRPYPDMLGDTQVYFITISTLMYSNAGQIIGVSSTDWSLDTITAYLEKFSLLPGAFLVLVDKQNNVILYHPNQDLVLKPATELPWFVKFQNQITAKTYSVDDVSIEGDKYSVIAGQTDIGYQLAMCVPMGESYSRAMWIMIVYYTLTTALIIIATLFLSRLLHRFILSRITRINAIIKEVETGHYDISIPDTSQDEITRIGHNIVRMASTIKTREQSISELQLLLAGIIDSMPAALITLRENDVVDHWNIAAAELFNLHPDSLRNAPVWQMVPALEPFRLRYHECLDANRPVNHPLEQLTTHAENWFSVSIFPLRTRDRKGGVIIFTDITELENKNSQLQQAQKMEAVGTLAGGLAHDFNNALGGITGMISLLLYDFNRGVAPDHKTMKEGLEVIELSAKRASEMVQQLLVLSRKKEHIRSDIDLKKIIENTSRICASTFQRDVQIKVDIPCNEARALGDAVEIEQALLNLAINGYHAMTIMRGQGEPQGGTLHFSLEEIFADQLFCQTISDARLDTPYWLISVRDTGIGIRDKDLNRIFDPFFTTKQAGVGTGLGLAMTYTIVKRHEGFIKVYSEPGTGTSFSMYLPAVVLPGGGTCLEHISEPAKGNGTILIIEDDPVLRNATTRMLETCGYRIISAGSGAEGVALFKRKSTEISLVLLDLFLPDLSGSETLSELHAVNRDIPVLLTSGFYHDERVDQLIQSGVSGFIPKPFTLRDLSLAVAKAIKSATNI